jgi:putative membrane protein
MLLASEILTALVLMIHVYIVVLETVLFRSRGRKVFGIASDKVDFVAPLMANQGCYNFFLVAALVLGFVYPEPRIAMAFQIFGLCCVAVAGIFGAITVMVRIIYIQTLPAALALITLFMTPIFNQG